MVKPPFKDLFLFMKASPITSTLKRWLYCKYISYIFKNTLFTCKVTTVVKWITASWLFIRTQNHWHASVEWGQPAKCKIIVCYSLACACDKSKCRTTISTLLTLYSHPTVDTGSGPNDVEHNLLSCQVHLLLSAVEIHPLVIWACENRSTDST